MRVSSLGMSIEEFSKLSHSTVENYAHVSLEKVNLVNLLTPPQFVGHVAVHSSPKGRVNERGRRAGKKWLCSRTN